MNIKDYIRVFAWSEFKNINGSNYARVLIIYFIFIVVLLAIAASKMSISILASKMDDPFVKFLNVTKTIYDENPDFEKNEDKLQNLGCSEVLTVTNDYLKFYDSKKKLVSAFARVIDEKDAFASFLKPYSDIIQTDNLFSNDDWGCIVTESFLKKLNVNVQDGYVEYVPISHKEAPIYIPIAAVAKELPDYTDVLINANFYNLNANHVSVDMNSDRHQRYQRYFLSDVEKLDPEIEELDFDVIPSRVLAKGILIERNIRDDKGVIKQKVLSRYPNAKHIYNLDLVVINRSDKVDPKEYPDYFSFSLNDLDKVENLKDFLLEEYGLRIDMSVIENKRNFEFLRALISNMSYVLFGFASFIVIFFTSNTIISHLNQNQKNVGTLKAFGLSNNAVITTYGLIAFVLVSFSFSLAYITSLILGNSATLYLKSKQLDFFNDDFHYDNYSLGFFILLFVVFPTSLVFLRLLRNLNMKTPGDLIYQR